MISVSCFSAEMIAIFNDCLAAAACSRMLRDARCLPNAGAVEPYSDVRCRRVESSALWRNDTATSWCQRQACCLRILA